MAIISQKSFEKLTEEEKQAIRNEYQSYQEDGRYSNCEEDTMWAKAQVKTMIRLFGKENLQPTPPIKTWEDIVAKEEWDVNSELEKIENAWIGYPICDKMIATAKIAKLIELGYGGMIPDAKWKNKSISKWIVVPNDDNGKLIIVDTWHNSKRGCIAFHTQQQAEEFMSYPENKTLIEQYYMI